jgi:hypothetical protein
MTPCITQEPIVSPGCCRAIMTTPCRCLRFFPELEVITMYSQQLLAIVLVSVLMWKKSLYFLHSYIGYMKFIN